MIFAERIFNFRNRQSAPVGSLQWNARILYFLKFSWPIPAGVWGIYFRKQLRPPGTADLVLIYYPLQTGYRTLNL